MIPLSIRPRCQRQNQTIGAARASIYCPGGIANASYSLFASARDADGYWTTTRDGDARNDCGDAPSGSSSYSDKSEHTVGELKCYVANKKAWIEWTNNSFDIYAYAFRDDGDWRALFNFWTGAGPEAP